LPPRALGKAQKKSRDGQLSAFAFPLLPYPLPLSSVRVAYTYVNAKGGWLGLAVAASRALADADCVGSEPPSETKGKSHESKGKCPSGTKYSAAKKSCVK